MKLYYNYIYCTESHFVTFLVGGVPQDFFQFKKCAVTQIRLKRTELDYCSRDVYSKMGKRLKKEDFISYIVDVATFCSALFLVLRFWKQILMFGRI